MLHSGKFQSPDKMRKYIFMGILTILLAGGCGPKEPGTGLSSDAALAPRPTSAELLRQPITGMNNTQKMLYWQNRPDVMENIQNWRLGVMKHKMGISPEDPAYREVPKQLSPFRQ